MANEFEKRMKRDMEQRLARRSPGHANFVQPQQSNESFFIGRVSTEEDTVEIPLHSSSLSPNEFGHNKPRNFKNKIEEALYDAEQELKKKDLTSP